MWPFSEIGHAFEGLFGRKKVVLRPKPRVAVVEAPQDDSLFYEEFLGYGGRALPTLEELLDYEAGPREPRREEPRHESRREGHAHAGHGRVGHHDKAHAKHHGKPAHGAAHAGHGGGRK